MSPYYILSGVEVLLIGAAVARLRGALQPYKRAKKRGAGPILLPEFGSGPSGGREVPSSRP